MRKNSLNRFDEGSSHSKNPLGGIPLGVGSNGKMNTTQEGETKQGDFVFSNDITLTKDMIKEYNLPSNLEGKTAASATKIIDNKFKDRNDKISLSTKNKMLDGIALAQENIKSKRDNLSNALNNNSTEVPDMMNGDVPPGFEEFIPQNQMFLGGMTDEVSPEGGISPMNVISGLAGSANLLNQTGGNTSTNGFNAALSGAGTGASVGSILGPVGTGIGAVVGAGLGLFGSGKARDKVRAENTKQHLLKTGIYNNDFALGGPLRPKVSSVLNPEATDELNLNNNLASQYYFDNLTNPTAAIPSNIPNADTSNILPKANLKPAVDWLGNNYGNILRYAPVVGNAIELSNLKRPSQVSLNRLDNRFRPDYVDERSLQNTVANEADNTINSLTNATNGSMGALRNSITAASLNKTKALSDAYFNADNINRNQNIQGQQFNAGIDQTNLSQDNLEQDINDRNTGAYETNKSRLKSALYEDIGNIGKEEVYKDIAKRTFGYSWNGRYWVKPDGTTATDAEVKSEVASNTNQSKLGGMLLKKKK